LFRFARAAALNSFELAHSSELTDGTRAVHSNATVTSVSAPTGKDPGAINASRNVSRERSQSGEQNEKQELLTTLLTDCLLANGVEIGIA
jgi:hypothetical protein